MSIFFKIITPIAIMLMHIKKMNKVYFSTMCLLLSSPTISKPITTPQLQYYAEHYPPSVILENGEQKGYAIELLDNIWRHMGMPNQKVNIVPWARAYHYLKTMNNIVLFSISRTPMREELFQWACPIAQIRYSLLALKKNKISIRKVNELSRYTIGSIRGDASETLLLKIQGNKKNIYSISSQQALIEMLMVDRVQLITHISVLSELSELSGNFIERSGFSPDAFEEVFTLGEYKSCFAFSKEVDKKFVNKFQQALSYMNKQARHIK